MAYQLNIETNKKMKKKVIDITLFDDHNKKSKQIFNTFKLQNS